MSKSKFGQREVDRYIVDERLSRDAIQGSIRFFLPLLLLVMPMISSIVYVNRR